MNRLAMSLAVLVFLLNPGIACTGPRRASGGHRPRLRGGQRPGLARHGREPDGGRPLDLSAANIGAACASAAIIYGHLVGQFDDASVAVLALGLLAMICPPTTWAASVAA